MSDKSQLQTEHSGDLAEDLLDFNEMSFWKRVAVISAGLFWLGITRLLLPALLVTIVVEVLL